MRNLITTAVAALLLAGLSPELSAQDPGGSPVYRIHSGLNELSLYRQFTVVLEHSAKIKSVQDFDADILAIQGVNKNPQQIRVSALETGVTTVTIQDEHGQYYQVEILVEGDARHLQTFLARQFPDDDIQVREIKGAVQLTGWVTEPSHITQVVEIAEQFYSQVYNHMQVGGAQQVQLKCEIMEVQRSKIRRFGMNFQFLRNDAYLISTPGPITPIQSLNVTNAGPVSTLTGFADSTLSFGFIDNNRIFQGFVQALREEGLLKIHATPMVTTLNGQPATLLNGGETPVVVPAGLGTTGIEFKEFGVQLEAVPHILGNGRLRMQVRPEVSERDFSNAVTVNGITVPAFTVRRASTEVEMAFGETMVIAGLISQREDASTSKVPVLGELPWIGAAFSRKRYSEAETELIILVTPEYTAPLSSEQRPAGGPGKFTDTPTDRELILHNLIEVPSYGDACQYCTECMQSGSCQQHPNGCRSCQDGTDCVKIAPKRSEQSGLARSGKEAGFSAPDSKTVPAGYRRPQQNKDRASGLISPAGRNGR